jgi:hypothetical protein
MRYEDIKIGDLFYEYNKPELLMVNDKKYNYCSVTEIQSNGNFRKLALTRIYKSDFQNNKFEKVSIKELSPIQQEAYIKWKLDQL